ncbi:hypothetical protein KBC03_05475 [Patescibacteria group bacterium]|nr:hypothetical protein [Patescibacteria group bacterium]
MKNRKGHVEAFKNSGIVIDPHAFDKIYNNAKTLGTSKEKYSSHPELNAVAIVGYYRQGLKPTTGFVGFGGVESVAGDKFREDASKEKDVHNKFLEIYKNSPDFAAQKEMIQKSIKKFDAKAEMSDAQLIDLIKTGKITLNGMDITMTGNTFERFLNAPCANEGYKQGFGQLEITYSKKTVKPAPGNIYVAMGSTGSENSANSFKIGLGAAYGEAPKQKKPDTPPPPPPPEPEPEPEVEGEPDSNPVDPGDGINTESHNGDINVINDDPSDDPSDDGDREP